MSTITLLTGDVQPTQSRKAFAVSSGSIYIQKMIGQESLVYIRESDLNWSLLGKLPLITSNIPVITGRTPPEYNSSTSVDGQLYGQYVENKINLFVFEKNTGAYAPGYWKKLTFITDDIANSPSVIKASSDIASTNSRVDVVDNKINAKTDTVDFETLASTVAGLELSKADAIQLTVLSQLLGTKADQSYVVEQIGLLLNADGQLVSNIQAISDALSENEGVLEALDLTVANRVRFDVATQSLTSLQKSNARTNIGAEETGTASLLIAQITASSIGAATALQGSKADTAIQSADLAPVAFSGDFNSLINKPEASSGGGLSYVTETFQTASSGWRFSDTVSLTLDSPANTSADVSLLLRLKGSAPLIIESNIPGIPAKSRGYQAIDIQTYRNQSTQVASGTNSVALGLANTSSSNSTVAIGYGNNVTGNGALAVGINNNISGSYSTIVGYSSNIQSGFSVAMGSDVTITATSTDSVAIGRFSSVNGSSSISIGAGAQSVYGIAIGSKAKSQSANWLKPSVAIGESSSTTGEGSVIIGSNAQGGSYVSSVVVGSSSYSGGARSVSLGGSSYAVVDGIAIGDSATTIGSSGGSIAIGSKSSARGNRSVCIGYGVMDGANSSICFGMGSISTIGDWMFRYYMPYGTTSSVTPYSVLTTDGSPNVSTTNVYTFRLRGIFNLKGSILARTGDGDVSVWEFNAVVKSGSASNESVFLSGPTLTRTVSDPNSASWDVVCSLLSNDRLNFAVTGSSTKIVRWGADIRITELIN